MFSEAFITLGVACVIGTIADHGGKDGIPVEFFGKLAMTPVGSMRLAKKMNAVVILAFMRRVRGARHEMILKSYDLVSGPDAREDIGANFSNINKVFEDWIRLYPEEYLWFYKRWKYLFTRHNCVYKISSVEISGDV